MVIILNILNYIWNIYLFLFISIIIIKYIVISYINNNKINIDLIYN